MTQEQKDQIARIEEMLAKLKAELEQPITKDELTRETGKLNVKESEYYAIGADGEIGVYENDSNDFTIDCGNFYNSFKTEAEAKTEAAYTLASRRVRAFAKAVNGEWKADWIDTDQEKYGIIYNENTYDARFRRTSNEFIHQIAFPTEELAAKALELFRDEWQILANP